MLGPLPLAWARSWPS